MEEIKLFKEILFENEILFHAELEEYKIKLTHEEIIKFYCIFINKLKNFNIKLSEFIEYYFDNYSYNDINNNNEFTISIELCDINLLYNRDKNNWTIINKLNNNVVYNSMNPNSKVFEIYGDILLNRIYN